MKLLRMQPTVIVLALLALVPLGLVGCSDDDDDNGTGPQENPIITGRVLGSGTTGIQGARVVLARIESDGTLDTISTAADTTDASGRFTLRTDQENVGPLVVVASHGGETWMAVASGRLSRGSALAVAPVGVETTAEARLYIRLIETGNPQNVSFADVAFLVDPAFASALTEEEFIETAATGITAGLRARGLLFADPSFGLSSSQISAFESDRARALAELEVDLFEAEGNQAAIDAAYETYNTAVLNAYRSRAGLDAWQVAQALQVNMTATRIASDDLPEDAGLALVRSSARSRAHVVDLAIRQAFEDMDAPQSNQEAVEEAGADLRTAVQAAASAAAVEEAFQAYEQAILTELQAVAGANAAAIAAINEDVNAQGGARSQLRNVLTATNSEQAQVTAYVNFFGQVRSDVEDELSGQDQEFVDAVARVLVLLNMIV